jgi:hypothetical protein
MLTVVGSRGGRKQSAHYLTSQSRTAYTAVDGRRPTWFVDRPGTLVRQLAGPKGFEQPAVGGPTSIWTTNLAPSAIPGSWQTPNVAWLRALPRDPVTLRERLYADAAGHGQSLDGEVLVLVADVLRTGLVPSDLRAALFRVLATVPGVKVQAGRTTVNGRTGVAIGRDETAGVDRQEIVVDPETGQLIGERRVAIRGVDGIRAGTVLGDTAVGRTLVDAVPTDVVRRARPDECTVEADGAVSCRR